jgi:hypothetical protein
MVTPGQSGPLANESPAVVLGAGAANVSGTLGLGSPVGNLTPEFWGVNYNYQAAPSGYANHTVAALLNETPITWIRFPLNDTSYQDVATWQAVVQFCDWVHCHSIATVGGPGITAAEAASDVARAEGLGIHPSFWVLGNEPNLWPLETSVEYANLVHAWIPLVHDIDPSAQILGAEITGNPSVGSQYIYNVTKIDGSQIQGLAIQVYPQIGGSTLADFLGALTAGASVQNAILNARALMASACPTCTIPLLLNEVNGGSGFNGNYIPYREGSADATFLAASMIQGLRLGLAQFSPWTLTGESFTPASVNQHCDFGMIQLRPGCDGEYLQPSFSLYQNLLTQLPYGALVNVTFPGAPSFYGIQSTNGTSRSVLLVNADATQSETFALGSGFPTEGTVLSSLMDASHAASPLVSSAALSPSSPPAFSLPPNSVMVLRFLESPGVAVTATPSSLSLGQTTVVDTQVFGTTGVPTYSYPKLPPGCAGANLSELACTPNASGSFPTLVRVSVSGSFVASAETNITVAPFNTTSPPETSPVMFVESGLPSGTTWGADVNGTVLNSSSSTFAQNLPNGTYVFTVDPVVGFGASLAGGVFTVAGSPQVILVEFTAETGGSVGRVGNTTSADFAISFEATGLSQSPNWTLVLDGAGLVVTGDDITADLSVGTHSFAVNATGYTADPAAGIAVSTGASLVQQIDFAPLPPTQAAASPAGSASGFVQVVTSLTFLVAIAATALIVAGAPTVRRAVRRHGYSAWVEEEVVRIQAHRQADLVQAVSEVSLVLASYTPSV